MVKQGWGNNGIMQRDRVENLKGIGYWYPPYLRSPPNFSLVVAPTVILPPFCQWHCVVPLQNICCGARCTVVPNAKTLSGTSSGYKVSCQMWSRCIKNCMLCIRNKERDTQICFLHIRRVLSCQPQFTMLLLFGTCWDIMSHTKM